MGEILKLEARERAQRTRLQSRQPARCEPSPLTPELKEFIDRAIVPILVKEYLAITNGEIGLAEKDSDAAHSVRYTAAQELRAVRP